MNAFVPQTLPTVLLGLLVKSACLLLTAWAVCGLLRRASAATRHLVWSAALGGVLLLPLLALSLPHWDLALGRAPVAAPHPTPPAPEVPIPSGQARPPFPHSFAPLTGKGKVTGKIRPQPPQDTVPGQIASRSPATVPLPRREGWRAWASRGRTLFPVAVWLLGVIATIVRLTVGIRRVERIRRQAISLDDAALALAESLRGRLGVRRPVAFLRAAPGSGVSVPLTWGGRRPTVLMPEQSGAWSEENLRAALLHELAHVARWDWTTQTVSRLVCALYWVNPLVWLAARAARAESERACDDSVLAAGLSAADYAQRLVDVVRSMPPGPPLRTAAIAMAQPSEVESRLRALLAKGRNRRPLTRRLALGTLAVFLLLALPLAALRLVAQAQITLTAADIIQPAPGGGTIRLVGISDYPSGPGTWWGKDGVRLATPPAWTPDRSCKMFLSKGQQAREFVLEASGTKPGDSLTVIGPSTSSTCSAQSDQGHSIQLGFIGGITATQQTCTLRVGVAFRPWQTLAAHSSVTYGGESFSTDTDIPAGVVRVITLFSPETVFEGKPSFTVTNTALSQETRLVAIDRQGRTIVAENRESSGAGEMQQRTIWFPTLALKDIKELQLQWRPYDWVEFKDVPLQPVASGANVVPAAPESHIVQLAGVSTYPPTDATWWGQGGDRLAQPPADWRALPHTPVNLQMGQKAREFLLSITPARPGDQSSIDPMGVLMDGPSKNVLLLDSHQIPGRGGLRVSLVNALPAAQATGTFRIGVASGPWQTLGTPVAVNPNGETALTGSSAELGNYSVRLSPPSVVGGVLTFVVTYTWPHQPAQAHAVRFDALDAGGKHVLASLMRRKTAAGTWEQIIRFPTLTLRDIRQIQLQERSYDWTAFNNVPLQPVGLSASFGPPVPTQLPPVFVGFRRYVSLPTPDGMRYTFLYPAYLTKISADKTTGEASLLSGPTPVSWTPAQGIVPATYPTPPNAPWPPPAPLEDNLSVTVGQKYPQPTFGGPPPRRDRQWAAGAGRSHHDIAMTDPRTMRRFWLNHDTYAAPALFRQTDPVISESFRLLPPGAPVPSGTQMQQTSASPAPPLKVLVTFGQTETNLQIIDPHHQTAPQNTETDALARQIAALELKLALNAPTYGPNHPLIAETKAELMALRQQLSTLRPSDSSVAIAVAAEEVMEPEIKELADKMHTAQLLYGPNHPSVAVPKEQIASVQRRLSELRQAATSQGVSITPHSLTKTQAKAAIQQMCSRMDAAMNRRDVPAMLAFLAPEFRRVSGDGADIDQVGFAAEMQRIFAQPSPINARTQVLQATASGNQATAVVTQSLADGPNDGTPRTYTMRQMWTRTGEGWLLTRIEEYTEVTAQTQKMAAPAASLRQASADTDQGVVAAQDKLRQVTGGMKVGINTSEDVDKATIALAEARLRVAVAQKQSADTIKNLGVIVARRQDLLTIAQTKYKVGLVPITDVDKAKMNLAKAQTHLRAVSQTPTPAPALTYAQIIEDSANRAAIVSDANHAISQFLHMDVNQRHGEEIQEKFWGEAIRKLKPIRVVNDRLNVMIVLYDDAQTEQGLYVTTMISSYGPLGDYRFTTFEKVGSPGDASHNILYRYSIIK